MSVWQNFLREIQVKYSYLSLKLLLLFLFVFRNVRGSKKPQGLYMNKIFVVFYDRINGRNLEKTGVKYLPNCAVVELFNMLIKHMLHIAL